MVLALSSFLALAGGGDLGQWLFEAEGGEGGSGREGVGGPAGEGVEDGGAAPGDEAEVGVPTPWVWSSAFWT